ncbi:hypothetical protein [Salinibacterium sp. ZJ450]|nr:hypothetical protein [Salinibacterium sp. ZJ450]
MGRHSAYQSPWWSTARHRAPGSVERLVAAGKHSLLLTTAGAMLIVLLVGTTPVFQE